MGTETERLDEEERLGAAVVSAVEDGADGKTEGHSEFCARGSSTYISHITTQRIVEISLCRQIAIVAKSWDICEKSRREKGGKEPRNDCQHLENDWQEGVFRAYRGLLPFLKDSLEDVLRGLRVKVADYL